MGSTKLERFFPKNQHTQRKSLNFEFCINGELSKSVPISLSSNAFIGRNIFRTSFLVDCRTKTSIVRNAKVLGLNKYPLMIYSVLGPKYAYVCKYIHK